MVTSGLLVGNYGTTLALSPGSRLALLEFWEVATFIVDSLLFLLLALRFDVSVFGQGLVVLAVIAGFVAIQAARAVIAYGLLGLNSPAAGQCAEAALADAARRAQLSTAVANDLTSRIDEALREGATSVEGIPDLGLYPEARQAPEDA